MKYLFVRLIIILKAILKSVLFFIPDNISIKRKGNIGPKKILIVRMDAIGDYILFRNFLRILRSDKKYSKYEITLCGNSAWKDIAEKYDSDFVDNFYWINRKKFLKEVSYRMKVLKEINEMDFEVVINPAYSRGFFTDTIVRAANSKEKIGNIGDCENIIWLQREVSNRYYTKLIGKTKLIFEYYRNKKFFEKILGRKILEESVSLGIKKRKPIEKYAVLFTMSNAKRRIWDMENFREIEKYLRKEKGLKTKVVDKNLNSINDLIDLIAHADIVISNDTSASHISAACDTPLICILHGRHFGRFAPYPSKIYKKGIFLYPPKITKRLEDFNYLVEKYKHFSNRNINEVTVDIVKESIDKLLP